MSALWPNISTPGVYQDNETCSGYIETDGNSSHNLLGRYPDNASGKGTSDATHLLGVPNVRSPRTDCEHSQITADSISENRISGFPSQLSLSTSGFSIRETEKDPVGCQLHSKKGGIVGQGNSKVCGKNHSFSASYVYGRLRCTTELYRA